MIIDLPVLSGSLGRFHVSRLLLLLMTLHGQLHVVDSKDCGNKSNKQVWYERQCKRCICNNGKIECSNQCKHKKSDRGQHASLSDMSYTACSHENIKRRDNESWHETGKHAKSLKSKGECMQCHCSKAIVTCTIRKCPAVSCKKKPIRKQGSCCLSCPDDDVIKKPTVTPQPVCHQSGSIFQKEATWMMYVPVRKGHGHCLRCKCNANEPKDSLSLRHVCTRRQCPPLTCNNPIGKPGRCCGICRDTKRTKRMEGVTKKKLNLMMLDIFKVIQESRKPKKQEEVISPVGMNLSTKQVKKGKKDCSFGMRQIYRHGQQFTPAISSCLRCTCQNALITCGKIVCPSSYSCDNPTYQPGLCCKVCPGVTVREAQKDESKNVVQIIKKTNGCSRSRTDYVRVYLFKPGEEKSSNRHNSIYLFNRVNKNKPSEMHTWRLNGDRTSVRVVNIEDMKPFLAKSKYLGFIKERILKRIHRHERELKNIRGRHSCISKMATMKKIISEKIRKKKHCKLQSGNLDTSSVLRTLQEVD